MNAILWKTPMSSEKTLRQKTKRVAGRKRRVQLRKSPKRVKI
jgi:hypothetical protein